MSRPSASLAPLVLSVGADPSTRAVVRESLAAGGFEVVERTRSADARTLARERTPDMVVLDLALEGADDLLRAFAAEDTLHVIALASDRGVERALELGADDCLTKPVQPALLVRRAEMHLRWRSAEEEALHWRARAVAAEQITPTQATGSLSDRDAFLVRLSRALETARPDRGFVAVLHVAIDFDGSVTESEGRSILESAAQRLQEGLRGRDVMARADGATESVMRIADGAIAVMLGPIERAQDAYKIARRLREHLLKPFTVEGRSVAPSVRIGIALHPEDGAGAAGLLATAARASRDARPDETGGVRFVTRAMDARVFERLALEASLRVALERGEIFVHYQPRVAIATGVVVGVEALARWKHPELGLVSPAHFIPIAEETGLIAPIGAWILREALQQARRWRDTGLPPLRVAVNLSPAQFKNPDLFAMIESALADAGLGADALELELTESLLLRDSESTVSTLNRLKSMGIGLAIDDFGTGYSSLSYIKRFPVDALKIDQSFVREMTTNAEDSALTTSIILMAKSLKLTVVAEGVETRSQLAFLRALECDEAQGYLFSRPVPPDEALAFLAAGFGAALAG